MKLQRSSRQARKSVPTHILQYVADPDDDEDYCNEDVGEDSMVPDDDGDDEYDGMQED